MKHFAPIPFLAIAALILADCAFAGQAVVDFEVEAPGTFFGGPADDVPGEVVLQQNGIRMSVEEYYLGTFVGFYRATVGGEFAGLFSSLPLQTDNISVLFDFSGLTFDVTRVTLEYKEFGGSDNFAVNGHTIHELTSLLNLPAEVAPGVSASVADGLITLTGMIDSFRIGGQELAIDNVTAVPEPGAICLLLGGAISLLRRRKSRRA